MALLLFHFVWAPTDCAADAHRQLQPFPEVWSLQGSPNARDGRSLIVTAQCCVHCGHAGRCQEKGEILFVPFFSSHNHYADYSANFFCNICVFLTISHHPFLYQVFDMWFLMYVVMLRLAVHTEARETLRSLHKPWLGRINSSLPCLDLGCCCPSQVIAIIDFILCFLIGSDRSKDG